jgi:hypothetical protein
MLSLMLVVPEKPHCSQLPGTREQEIRRTPRTHYRYGDARVLPIVSFGIRLLPSSQGAVDDPKLDVSCVSAKTNRVFPYVCAACPQVNGWSELVTMYG